MTNNYFKLFILSLFSSLFLFSCSNEDKSDVVIPDGTSASAPDVVFAIKTVPEDALIGTKGVGLRGKYWAPTQTVRIKFLNDGYDFAKGKVKQYASEWLRYANVNFQYVSKNEEADVKIAFTWQGDRVAWSTIGRDCLAVAQDLPSMNLPYSNDDFVSSVDYAAIVLREFGHVLGLAFEHQGPNAKFNWNQSSVLTYFLQQGWSEQKVYQDVFTTYTAARTNYTSFDESSIMLLYFPAHLTTDGRATKYNTALSVSDMGFIKQLYPGREGDPIPSPMSIKYTEGGSTYNYTAVRIGEYLWMNSNFRNPVYTPQLTQHQINRCVWVYRGDSLYQVTPQQVDQYVGQYYALSTRDSFNGKVMETRSFGDVEQPWSAPYLKDFRQLFAMCDDASEHAVREALCYKVGEVPIAQQMKDIFYMSGNNSNKFGFNLVYGGMRYHGDNPGMYSPWKDKRREIVINKTDIEGIFNMHVFYAKDGTALLEDYPNTLKWGRLWYWTPVRWCRKLSDAELGYRLYANADRSDIKKLSLTDAVPSGYTELGNGYLRGFYVQYILDKATPTMTVAQLRDMARNLPDVTHHGAPIE